jgi:tRNA threonylcarbamoyl adenosine modification protein YjeE
MLPDETATGRLAADIALALQPNDLVTLSGDLGAGKTTIARAIIRTLAGDETIEVPSPTFTLLQIYDLPRFPVVHADLYRVTTLAELSELGWEEAAEGAAVMVEWPERASAFIQADRLDVSLSLALEYGPDARQVRLTGFGSWAGRLSRFRAVRELLDSTGFGAAERIPIQGDASTRSYERLLLHPGSAILMNSPPRPDGPPIKDGKSYSAIAHLAEDVKPFVALARALRERGFGAPEIYAADIDNGLLLLEDLGVDGMVTRTDPPAPIEHLYASAVDVLVALHTQELPSQLPVSPRIEHIIPPYDLDAFTIEIELMLDWYLPYRGAPRPTLEVRSYFASMWKAALAEVMTAPKTWVLRDYHSPNLLWLPAREGNAQVGLLDFQDTVMGPAAYDVASLLMDARVDIPHELEITLLSRYAVGRSTADANFDPNEFARHYVTLGAQRATKILGIFARLAKRDQKPQYLAHLPRVWNYLMRALAHPSLTQLNAWYHAHVPPPDVAPPEVASSDVPQPDISQPDVPPADQPWPIS